MHMAGIMNVNLVRFVVLYLDRPVITALHRWLWVDKPRSWTDMTKIAVERCLACRDGNGQNQVCGPCPLCDTSTGEACPHCPPSQKRLMAYKFIFPVWFWSRRKRSDDGNIRQEFTLLLLQVRYLCHTCRNRSRILVSEPCNSGMPWASTLCFECTDASTSWVLCNSRELPLIAL